MFGKEKFVNELKTRLDLTAVNAELVFDTFIDITKVAAEADTVRLPGIGVIRKNDIPAHTGKKPVTGEAIEVPARFNYRLSSQTKPAQD